MFTQLGDEVSFLRKASLFVDTGLKNHTAQQFGVRNYHGTTYVRHLVSTGGHVDIRMFSLLQQEKLAKNMRISYLSTTCTSSSYD